jgi:hypothetical protein
MNSNHSIRSIAGMYRPFALSLAAAGALIALSGNLSHASADSKSDFDSLRSYSKKNDNIPDPPAAPEVATWWIGGAVLSIGGIGQLRRKWLATRQTPST